MEPTNPYSKPPQNFQPPQHQHAQQPYNPNPAVRHWQLVYVLVMAFFSLGIIGLGCFMYFGEEFFRKDPNMAEADIVMIKTMSWIYTAGGVISFVLYAVGAVWRKGMGGWIYNLVLLGLGLTSCCTWPATIPLMIYWIKDKDGIINSP